MKAFRWFALLIIATTGLLGQGPKGTYASRRPIVDYLVDEGAQELALSQSAAPVEVARKADVFVLHRNGYALARRGNNGFTCLVMRSWANEPDDGEFWNEKERSPICMNRAAAVTELPAYFERTKWVIAGVGREEIAKRTIEGIRSGHIPQPAPGAMSFMLSKQAYLSDEQNGPWRPHIMLFLPSTQPVRDWGANVKDSPVLGSTGKIGPANVVYIPVAKWSDGTDAPAESDNH